MVIQRDRYLQKLISRRENGMVKVITGIRRCGKSYLLFELYHQYLNADGVTDDHIIELALDEDENARYRNPLELGQYIRSLLVDKDKMYYVFLDEVDEDQKRGPLRYGQQLQDALHGYSHGVSRPG